jgi:hypothetical protein
MRTWQPSRARNDDLGGTGSLLSENLDRVPHYGGGALPRRDCSGPFARPRWSLYGMRAGAFKGAPLEEPFGAHPVRLAR